MLRKIIPYNNAAKVNIFFYTAKFLKRFFAEWVLLSTFVAFNQWNGSGFSSGQFEDEDIIFIWLVGGLRSRVCAKRFGYSFR